jgi:deoxyribose-phosphate aldolase
VVGFPLGYTSPRAKLEEAREAILNGAQELDMVMNIGAFKSGDFGAVAREITDVSRLCRMSKTTLKVIVECCYLTDEEKRKAASLAAENGADYIKTSTGFGPGGATVADVSLICGSLKGKVKVKAAGGISTLEAALEMLGAGADRLGTSSATEIMKEFEDQS